MNVGQHLVTTAHAFPGKVALHFEGADWTFRALNDLANRVANAFAARGIGAGDRVAVLTWNLPEQVATFYGLLRIGAVPVPVNYRLAANEVRYILANSGAKFLLIDDDTLSIAADLVGRTEVPMILIGQSEAGFATPFYSFIEGASDRQPPLRGEGSDIAFIMYTSGTTGLPKGVMRSHAAETIGAMQMAQACGFRATDVGIHNKPLFHIAQLQLQLIPYILIGASAVLTRGFDVDETMSAVARHRVTSLHGVPTQIVMLLNHDLSRYDTSSLRLGFFGGQTLNEAALQQFMGLFPEEFRNVYGATEVLAVSTCNLFLHRNRLSAAGFAVPGAEVRILRPGATDPEDQAAPGETGEIAVRTAAVMSGYLGLPERTARQLVRGWYLTGDGGTLTEDGCLSVFGRQDFTIKSGGENVHPSEVENTLSRHPGIRDVAVVGLPSKTWGEVICAAVVARDPGLSAADLDAFCLQSPDLANFKRPRHWAFVSEIPGNTTGKVDRRRLAEDLGRALSAPLP